MTEIKNSTLIFGKFCFLIGIFLYISQVHLHLNPALGSFENIFWLGAVASSTLNYRKIRPLHVLLMFVVLVIVFSGLLNGGNSDPAFLINYKYTWMTIAFTISGLLLFQTPADYNQFELTYLSASALMVFIFAYRYLVLHETREFDGRPVLHLRNGDPNFLAFLFSFSFFMSIDLKNRTFKYMALILFALATLMTQSRMGVISLLAGSAMLIYQKVAHDPRKKMFFIIFGITALVATLFAFPELLIRFENMMDRSNLERVKTWANGWQLFMANPWFGVGLDHSEKFYFSTQGFPLFQSLEDPLTVHNTYLKMLAEIGIVGSLPLLFWQASLVRRSVLANISLSKVIMAVVIFNSFFIGVAFKDFYFISFCLIEHKSSLKGLT